MKINPHAPTLRPGLLEMASKVAPATLGHLMNLRFMDAGIKPVYRRCKVVGQALTVKAPGAVDFGVLSELNTMAKPGDVIVIDRGGDVEHATMGEFRALKMVQLGVAGWIVDGSICDVNAIEDMGFPTFARAVSALVGKPVNLQGEVNTAVSCGGVVVHPGDLIIGDDDGVVVLSAEEAEELLPKCLETENKEIEMRKQFAAILNRNKK
jgi:4-hydroxy-4-methyl-2-oxoglutarate aldolase